MLGTDGSLSKRPLDRQQAGVYYEANVAPGCQSTCSDAEGAFVSQRPLKPLHGAGSLSQPKLAQFLRLSTEEIVESLKPGQVGALKARPDGTIVDGHHRIKVLRDRGVDVDGLPREILSKDPSL